MISKDKAKCYIYTRVSTALQVDGYSLDAQRETMRKYADFQNMDRSGNGDQQTTRHFGYED